MIKTGKKTSKNLDIWNKVIQMHKNKIPKSQISKHLKISREAIYRILTKCGLHKNEGKGNNEKITPEVISQIIKLRNNNYTWPRIEKEIGISHTHLFRIINMHKLKDGCYNGKNRKKYITLTKSKINKAKKLRKKGLTWQQIADILGICRQNLVWKGITRQFEPLRKFATEKQKKVALKLRNEGKKWKEISEIVDIPIRNFKNYFIKVEDKYEMRESK